MKREVLKYLLPLAAVLLALGVALFFFHPLAPLLLLLSILVQAGVLWLVLRNTQNTAYGARLDARRAQFDEDGDAETWLAQENAEASSLFRIFWSGYTRRQNTLARADLLHLTGREDEAQAVLAQVDGKALTATDRKHYAVLNALTPTEGQSSAAARDDGK